MKIWHVQVEEIDTNSFKIAQTANLTMIFTNLLENCSKHEAYNANLLKDCAN